jgi:hypothetical protein
MRAELVDQTHFAVGRTKRDEFFAQNLDAYRRTIGFGNSQASNAGIQ